PLLSTGISRVKPVAGLLTTTVVPGTACPKTVPVALDCANAAPEAPRPTASPKASAVRRRQTLPAVLREFMDYLPSVFPPRNVVARRCKPPLQGAVQARIECLSPGHAVVRYADQTTTVRRNLLRSRSRPWPRNKLRLSGLAPS